MQELGGSSMNDIDPVSQKILSESAAYLKARSEKEEYLDGIASRLSDMKMDGRPLSNSELLGTDLQRGAEMFGLQEFSPKVQTDIILNMAYYRSDAFKNRVVTSLGYGGHNELSPEDRELYDGIVDRAGSAYRDISFEATDNPVASKMSMTEDGHYVAHIADGWNAGPETLDSLNLVSHELAHYIYNPYDDGIAPGSDIYGRQDSPYNRISDSEIDPAKFIDVHKGIWESEEYRQFVEGETDSLPEEARQAAAGHLSKVRDSTKEELLNDKEFLERSTLHDNMGFERAADIHAADMLMLREGIWNPFGKEDLTPKQMQMFEERHPNSRIFEYWNQEEATRSLNTIARNDNGIGSGMELQGDFLQRIRQFDSQKFIDQLNQFSSWAFGEKMPELPQAEVDESLLANDRHISNGSSLSAGTLASMTAAAYEGLAEQEQQMSQQRQVGMRI